MSSFYLRKQRVHRFNKRRPTGPRDNLKKLLIMSHNLIDHGIILKSKNITVLIKLLHRKQNMDQNKVSNE